MCGATILIRRWIYGLNHRRIISDSRALLPPTETYACLFADNCTQLRARPLPLPLFLSFSLRVPLSVSLHSGLARLAPLSPRRVSLRSLLQYDVSGSSIRYQDFYDVASLRENEPLRRESRRRRCNCTISRNYAHLDEIVTRVSAPIVILRYPVPRAQLVIYTRIQKRCVLAGESGERATIASHETIVKE